MPRPLPGDPPPWIPEREHEIARQMWQQVEEEMNEAGADNGYDIFLTDNRGTSFRDSHEGRLLVMREAHEIRPPGDTGVVYELPADDSGLSLSLNDPTNQHLYNHDDLQLDSDHELCQACQDVLNYFCRWTKIDAEETDASSRPPRSNLVIHHFNILSLIAWASIDGCYLCQVLLTRVQARYPVLFTDLARSDEYRVEVCWPATTSREEQGQLCFVLTNPSKPKGQWNFDHLFRMNLWPTQKFEHYFDLSSRLSKHDIPEKADGAYREESSQLEDERVSTDGPVCQSLANAWLHDCLVNLDGKHTICNKDPSDFMPTRLLDVQSAEKTGYLRIVDSTREPETFIDDRKWVTLSHCWGAWGAKENPITKDENLQDREAVGIHVSVLPQTFQDALTITKWLNIRWLWIDSLCIIQDSKEDWIREASLMDQIYQHGLLNISANSGENSSVGCFAARDVNNVSAIQFSAPALKQSWRLTPDPAVVFGWMYEVPSLARVWINRERQLSRRILHFNPTELVWECCGTEGSAFASEMFPNGAPFKRLFNHEAKFQSGRLQAGLKPNDAETYAVWNDVCENFSSRGLTQPTDMPIVLSSLAKEFAELLPEDEYVAGLWSSTLPQSLAWKVGSAKRKDMHDPIAPSWSWMSVGCDVELENTWKWEMKRPLLDILDISLRPQYKDVYGLLEQGQLHVQGFLRPVRISSTENNFDLSVLEHGRYRRIGPARDAYHGNLCEARLDEPPATRVVECYCLPVSIRRWHISDYRQETTCLLLQKDGEEASDRFLRVGWLELGGVYSLKMRYTMASGYDDFDEELWTALTEATQRNGEDEDEGKDEKGEGPHDRREVNREVVDNNDDDGDDDDSNSDDKGEQEEHGQDDAISSHSNDAHDSTREERQDEGKEAVREEKEKEEELDQEEGSVRQASGNEANKESVPTDIVAILYQYDDMLAGIEGWDKLVPQTLMLV